MQNVLKRKNMHLERFQVILNFFPQNHMFYTNLNLLIIIILYLVKAGPIQYIYICTRVFSITPVGSVYSSFVTTAPYSMKKTQNYIIELFSSKNLCSMYETIRQVFMHWKGIGLLSILLFLFYSAVELFL